MASVSSDTAAYLSRFPQAQTPATPVQVAAADQAGQPVFRSLYQTGDRVEPVSATVRELWGNNTSLTRPLSESGAAVDKNGAPQGIGLFSDATGVFSG